MANLFAGHDPTWAHLPVPAPTHAAAAGHCCFFPAAAFENEALTSALRASMAPTHVSASASAAANKSFSSPSTPSSSTTSSASELLSSSGHDAPAASASRPTTAAAGRPPARALKGPKGGRVTKRKPRPSRRAQTTYITTDPANFRRMVQEITGLPVPGSASSSPAASEAVAAAAAAAAAPSWTPVPAPAFVLPTLDTSAFLLDRATAAPAVPPAAKCSSGSSSTATAAAAAGDHDSSPMLEMEAMIDYFPTLESWGII